MPTYKILLRENYYLEHFEYLLAFIKAHYAGMLNARERCFMQSYERLTQAARCLMVRLYNRQGIFFAVKDLQYAEVSDMAACLQELATLGLVDDSLNNMDEDWSGFLQSRTRNELCQAGQLLGYIENKTLSKAALIAVLSHADVDRKKVVNFFKQNNPIISLPFKQDYLTLKFMLFGDLTQAMSSFVLHELKGAAPLVFSAEKFCPAFSSRAALEESFAVQQAYCHFKKQRAQQDPLILFYHFMAWHVQRRIDSAAAQRVYDKYALKLSDHLERSHLLEAALEVYATTTSPPSRERQVRIYLKLGHHAAALKLCEDILINYRNAQEKQFAQDFLDKAQRRAIKKATTLYLQTAEMIQVQSSISIKPEQAVIDHFMSLGYQAYFSENYLWKGLFALLFWDLIYEKNAQYFHHPFQRMPSDLMQGQFYANRREQILQRLALLQDRPRCFAILKNTYMQHEHIENNIIKWHPDLFLLIERCCIYLNATQLSAILIEMANDWRHNSTGFPDLFIWQNGHYSFVEVKSPRDKLSAQQLQWLWQFKEMGISAKVVRVSVQA